MPRLSDTQSILLSTAAARLNSSVLPPADTVKLKGAGLERSLAALLRRGLISETPGQKRSRSAAPTTRRRDTKPPARNLVITAAGLDAIGIDASGVRAETDVRRATKPEATPDAAPSSEPVLPGGKLGLLLEQASRPDGASIEELSNLAGWLPHTTRAALSRLRQRGWDIQLETNPTGRKCYRLTGTA